MKSIPTAESPTKCDENVRRFTQMLANNEHMGDPSLAYKDTVASITAACSANMEQIASHAAAVKNNQVYSNGCKRTFDQLQTLSSQVSVIMERSSQDLEQTKEVLRSVKDEDTLVQARSTYNVEIDRQENEYRSARQAHEYFLAVFQLFTAVRAHIEASFQVRQLPLPAFGGGIHQAGHTVWISFVFGGTGNRALAGS